MTTALLEHAFQQGWDNIVFELIHQEENKKLVRDIAIFYRLCGDESSYIEISKSLQYDDIRECEETCAIFTV
jgi:hypothetical protein